MHTVIVYQCYKINNDTVTTCPNITYESNLRQSQLVFDQSNSVIS